MTEQELRLLLTQANQVKQTNPEAYRYAQPYIRKAVDQMDKSALRSFREADLHRMADDIYQTSGLYRTMPKGHRVQPIQRFLEWMLLLELYERFGAKILVIPFFTTGFPRWRKHNNFGRPRPPQPGPRPPQPGAGQGRRPRP